MIHNNHFTLSPPSEIRQRPKREAKGLPRSEGGKGFIRGETPYFIFLFFFIFLPLLEKLKPVKYLGPIVIFVSLFWLHSKVQNVRLEALWEVVIALVILGILLAYPYVLKEEGTSPDWWIVGQVVAMLVLLVLGTTFIDSLYGPKDLSLHLNNCTNTDQHLREIKCSSISNTVIVDDMVSCRIVPSLQSFYGIANLRKVDGTNLTLYFNNSINFTVPDKMGDIGFDVTGVDNKGKNVCFSTGHPVRYPTYQEYKDNKNRFVGYFLGLLGFCLLSVPMIVTNFRKTLLENS